MSILRKIAGNVRQQELGFGNNATTNNRVMNSDGSFNVKRQSLSIWDNTYYYLITMPGWAFLSVVV
ncbi:MAG TPA: hypothetical protein PLW66_13770, partial [Saprospiraceae bacterium]|nr:hypothetical protein [Saprospiraceae bacterium]